MQLLYTACPMRPGPELKTRLPLRETCDDPHFQGKLGLHMVKQLSQTLDPGQSEPNARPCDRQPRTRLRTSLAMTASPRAEKPGMGLCKGGHFLMILRADYMKSQRFIEGRGGG